MSTTGRFSFHHFFCLASRACVGMVAIMSTALNTAGMAAENCPKVAARSINQLGLQLLQAWPGPADNLCLSPYSITAALAMTYPGSAGETRAQMSKALEFPRDPETLASSFQALDGLLAETPDDPDVALRRANRLFGQAGYPFRPPFLSLLAEKFSAPLEETDFATGYNEAKKTINTWVEEQTAGRIQDLLPDGSLDEETRLVLVNALYFKAPWVEEFAPGATTERPFTLADGNEVPVPMMRQTSRMGYLALDGATVIALPYRGLPFQFLAILPNQPIAEARELLSPELFERCAEIPSARVTVQMPKFRLEPPTMNLTDLLGSMGMPSAFDRPRGSADFDAMAPRRPNDYLFISGVYHKTFIELDEKGTEAAAATAVAMMRATSIDMEEPVEVNLDRPFFYAIQHKPTGALFFLGRLMDPR